MAVTADKSLAPCTKASSTLALKLACSSLLRFRKTYGFSYRARLRAFAVASSCPYRISSRNSTSLSSIRDGDALMAAINYEN